MRILIISNIFPPGFIGGYELGALDVARGLNGAGHEVHVLTSDYFADDEATLSDFPILRVLTCMEWDHVATTDAERVRRGIFVFPGNLRRIGSELIAFQPDVVLVFNSVGLGVVGLMRFLVGTGVRPVLYLMDDVFCQLLFCPRHRESASRVFGGLDFVDHVSFIMMSQGLRSEVEHTLDQVLSDVTIVPGWSNPRVDHSSLPAIASADDGKLRLVFSSRVADHKGIDIVVGAARRLREAGHDDFVIDVFGAGETTQLMHQITAYGLVDCIRYRGVLSKDEMTRRFPEYDALLFPTWEREPFGFVVPEAAVAGCIPVMTGGIGAAEWFFDGIDCLKIRRDVIGLSEAIAQLLLMAPADLKAMQRCCQQTGLRFFAFDDALLIVESVLRRAADHSMVPDRIAVRGAEAALTLLDDMWRYNEIARL